MQKRFFLTFFTILVFFLIYSYFVNKFFPQVNKPVTSTTQANLDQNRVMQADSTAVPAVVEPVEVADQKDLATEAIGNFSVTFSARGGYISKVKLVKYGDELLYTNIGYVEADKDTVFSPKISGNTLQFTAEDGSIKEYKFDIYTVTLNFSKPTTGKVILFTNSLYANSLSQGYQEVFHVTGNNVKRFALQKVKQDSYKGVESAGARDRYFCIALLRNKYNIDFDHINKKVIASTTSALSSVSYFIGPQMYSELKKYDLDTIINFGFFHDIGILILNILHFFYSLVHNWGVSIILFALLTYIVLFPFTMMSTKALKKISDMQPIVEELKKKYKDDVQKMNKEVMELYKKHKINPLGGCLPVVLQLPVFIALYQVFMRLIELKGANFLWIKDLSMPDQAFALPFPPPVDFINVLPILITILSFVQQKTTTTPSGGKDQKMMMMILPLFMGFIFYNFPSCLNLYWFIQNILTYAYQYSHSRASKKSNTQLTPAH